MLLLSALLMVMGLVGMLAGAVRMLSCGRQWLWTCAGLVAGSAGLAAGGWSPVSNVDEPFAVIGAGVMLCAVVVLVRMGVMAWRWRERRWRGLGAAVAASIGVAAVGWGVSVWWPAKEYGWWLVMPRVVRIEAVPWLPEGAVDSIWPQVAAGESEPRDPLNGWEKWRLEGRLERLVRDRRDLWSLERYLRLGGAESDELTGLVLGSLVARFCDESIDPRGQAWGLSPYFPFQWKSNRLPLSRDAELRAMTGRVPRLIELSTHSDWGVNRTAVILLCLCGPEATEALPRLAEIIARGDEEDAPYHAAVDTLRHLLTHEPAVLHEVLSRLEAESREERLIAIWSLTLPNWEQPPGMEALERLLAHNDPETRKAAARALRVLRPEASSVDYLPSNQFLAM